MSDALFTETIDGISGEVRIKVPDSADPPRAPRRRGAERRTSRNARRDAERHIAEHHYEVLATASNLGTFTHTELTSAVNFARRASGAPLLEGSTVRSRCNEMQRLWKLVTETGEERKSRRDNGSLSRMSTVWRVTALGELRLAEWRDAR